MGVTGAAEKWTKRLGLDTAPVPYDVYTSAEQYRLEQQRIFKKCWLNLGRVCDIPKPGDYRVYDLAVLNTSVLLVHATDGKVRAFHNICSHRGNKVAQDYGGCKRYFACEFHGWTYDSAGCLVHLPDEAEFFDLDKATLGLPEIATDLWEGFIFVNVDPKPRETLREYLGEVVDLLAGFPFDRYRPIFGYEGYLDCNWKLAVDSQQEGYHAPHLHRRTLGNTLGGDENPELHMLEFRVFRRHRMLSMPAGTQGVKRGPVDQLAAKYGLSIRNYQDHKGTEGWPKGLNPTRSPNWAADLYLIYPNFWIAPFDGMFQTHNWWPLGPDRLHQRIRMYGPEPRKPSERWALEYARCMSKEVWLEDLGTLEASQMMIASGVRKEMHLQDQEVLVRHFHRVVQDEVHT